MMVRAVFILLLAAISLRASSIADAAEKMNRTAVRSLLDSKADVNSAQPDGMTALHWAAYQDDLGTAKLLIAAGANVGATNHYGVAPLSLACQNGNGELVELILARGADANTTLRGGETALMTAARTGKIRAVKALLAKGANVNARERKNQTAIMWAASEGYADVIQALIDAGADFKTPLDSGFTPFLFAVREGRADATRVFLKAGVDVNATLQPKRGFGRSPRPGTTALNLAIESGHFELAVALLEAGADPNDQRSGFTPLHSLTWVRKPPRGDGEDGDPPPQGSGNLTSLQFAKELVKRGADVDGRLKNGKGGKAVLNKMGMTPLMMAAMTADAPYMRTLVDLGADPKLQNADHSTLLMAAAGLGCLAAEEEAGTDDEAVEAVKFCFELGADANVVDDNGETAMHGAAYKNLPKVVECLAAHGAKIETWNKKNKWGWTPVAIAEGHRPGNFKPSFETIAALHKVMIAAGVTPPKSSAPGTPEGEDYKGATKSPVAGAK